MSEVRVNNLSNENNTGGPTISGITTYSGRHFYVPPQGDTSSRPEDCEPGSLRFNTDTLHLEYFRGNTIGWTEIEAELASDILGGGSGSNEGLGVRALLAGGDTPSYLSHIDFITMSTMGDAADFGNLSTARAGSACISSRTTIAWCGGYAPGISNSIDTTIFSSTGNATDTADLTASKQGAAKGPGNNIRGLIAGGATPSRVNVIEYYTFEAAANAVDFGDLSDICSSGSGCSSSTRTVFNFGYVAPARVNTIEFVTTSTTGNATDFGDMLAATQGGGAMSSPTRCVYYSGNGGASNVIEFVEIATLGNTVDFGDAATGSHGKYTFANFSNGHGGL